mmetsp:Transcript_45227/g.97906  ORF Transcript_45227/g.97906 Transcript_45227/m.97906 type:complete len:100 (+) Transcript_45227:1276-1575(+)
MTRLHQEYSVLRRLKAEVHLLEAKEASLGSAVRAMVASTLGEFSRQHTHSRDAHRAIKLHPRWSQTPLAQPPYTARYSTARSTSSPRSRHHFTVPISNQ